MEGPEHTNGFPKSLDFRAFQPYQYISIPEKVKPGYKDFCKWWILLTKSKESVKIIIKEKSVTVQQRFTWFLVTDQESNLFLARAVAFLMFMFPCSLYDTDKRYDDTDDRNNNTDNAYHCFQHLMYLSIDFPSVSPPIILEALKMSSFWRKVNRLPFW